MRVLILSAVLACAIAAPSSPIITPVVKAIPIVPAIPAAVPTIDPGDIQAAAINAQVFAEDQSRAFADKIREQSEQAVENTNDKVIENIDLAKEKTEEGFWNVEDKKWQVLDAVKTAEAKIDGAVANNAEVLAKSALGGVVVPNYIPFPAPIAPFPAPIATPVISPIIYAAPGLIAKPEFYKPEEKKDVKAEDTEKKDEKKEEQKSGLENQTINQSAEPEKTLGPIAPVFVAPALKPTFLAGPAVYSYIPGQIAAVPQYPSPLLTPVIRTQW